ncbi:MAG: hypothetical protein DI535_02240 [Citrobacter freundii]|nr:MAG: hypothetical protein DI535_02240 [Citrobacter freundii]
MSRFSTILLGYALPALLFVHINKKTEPCEDSKNASSILSDLARSKIFNEAKDALTSATTDGKEHTVVFGKDALGNNIISQVKSAGLKNRSSVEPNFPGAFADMHNHPANTVPSTGDIYNLIRISGKTPLHNSRITLLANGIVYAVSIYNDQLASAFIKDYPAEESGEFSPRFPEKLFNEFAELKSYLIGIQRMDKTKADEMATAYILDKYQSGVALFRLLEDNTFARVYITQQKSPNGNTVYQFNSCK